MSNSKKANQCTWERMNTHETLIVEQEVMGHHVRLAQNPNTSHLGTTVWDASIVLAKYLEKNMRKGEFSRPKVKGKRVIELGAGMGLGGIAFAMLGASVVLTDQAEVLPLLKRNTETNLGVGVAAVEELDWFKPEQVAALKPPFDIVIAADCIYHEHIVEHFHRTVMELTTEKSAVLVVNELRSHSVHAAFMNAFTPTHSIKVIPHSKMDDVYQHPNIQIFYMKKKRKDKGTSAGGDGEDDHADEAGEQEASKSPDQGRQERGAQPAAPEPVDVVLAPECGEQHTDGNTQESCAEQLKALSLSLEAGG